MPNELRPHPGPQEDFLTSPADIIIYGGGGGGGKSFGLLLEGARNIGVAGFNAALFRSTYPQLVLPGGLWDESQNIYRGIGGAPLISKMFWTFPAGSKITMAHIGSEKEKYNWTGSQIPFIGFDQLEDFSEETFFFMLSRNRSTCGVAPYVRATCNPDAEVWIARFIEWYIDSDGYPDIEKYGTLRYFYRVENDIKWYDTAEQAKADNPEIAKISPPKSFTFIPADVYDNPTLLKNNPEYVANLMALPLVERERLLKGNWKIKHSAGNIFNRSWFQIVQALPAGGKAVRYWDKAGTKDGGCYTAGVKIWKYPDNQYVIEDCTKGQWSAFTRETIIKQTAELDGVGTAIVVEMEPGSGGKESAESTIKNLSGFDVSADRVTGAKVDRWQPYAAQLEAGNIKLLSGPWNREFIEHHHAADAAKLGKILVDEIDAASGAFNKLARKKNYNLAGAFGSGSRND